MNIITTHHAHGPDDMRWSAIDDDSYDYEAPIGWGRSEQDAIDDLLGMLADADDADSVLESLAALDTGAPGSGLDVAD